MLVSYQNGERIEAREATRGGGFTCPECKSVVHLHQGRIVIAHFAHAPGAVCSLSVGGGETIGHLTAKRLFCDAMRAQGLKAEIEYVVDNQRLDVAVWLTPDQLVAVEFQHSNLLIDDLKHRIDGYQSKGISQLWVPFIQHIYRDEWSEVDLYSGRPYEHHLMSTERYGLWFWDESYVISRKRGLG